MYKGTIVFLVLYSNTTFQCESRFYKVWRDSDTYNLISTGISARRDAIFVQMTLNRNPAS